jgi:hypothetical protein
MPGIFPSYHCQLTASLIHDRRPVSIFIDPSATLFPNALAPLQSQRLWPIQPLPWQSIQSHPEALGVVPHTGPLSLCRRSAPSFDCRRQPQEPHKPGLLNTRRLCNPRAHSQLSRNSPQFHLSTHHSATPRSSLHSDAEASNVHLETSRPHLCTSLSDCELGTSNLELLSPSASATTHAYALDSSLPSKLRTAPLVRHGSSRSA